MKTRWPWLVAAVFAGALFFLSRGVTVDTWDGVASTRNALVAAGARLPTSWGGLEVSRPPLGWLAASPLVAWRFASAGAPGALRLFQSLMILAVAALLVVTHRLAGRFASAGAAAAVLLAMAFNPLLIEFAPFVSMDLLAPLALVPFVWAAYRYDERPGLARYGLLLAAYVAAFLTKYHLGALIAVPLCYPLVDPKRRGLPSRLRAFVLNPVWLMPAVAWLAALLVWGVLSGRARGLGPFDAAAQAHRALMGILVDNVGGSASGGRAMVAPPSRLYYPWMLVYELGWPLALASAVGVYGWCRGRDALRLHAALALGVVFGFLVFLLYRPYAHYAFAALPLVYAAAAQGLDEAWKRLKKPYRTPALAAFALLLPWSRTLDAVGYLTRNPATHTAALASLAAAVEKAAGPDDCVGWEDGELILPLSGLPYEPAPLLYGRSTFAFFTTRRVAAPPEEGPEPDCRPGVVVVPRDYRQADRKPPRWDGPPLARVYREPDRTLIKEVPAD